MVLINFVLVAFGGALGSALRYAAALGCARLADSSGSFPYATLLVNVLGCFLMGACLPFAQHGAGATQNFRLLVMTGILGGFTTFSAFGGETMLLLNSDAPSRGVLNFALNPSLSLVAVWCGMKLASSFA